MATATSASSESPPTFWQTIALLFQFGYDFTHACLTDWSYFWWLGIPLLLCELILCTIMVHQVNYTKIDWDAYMEEVEGPLVHNNWDYTQLKGDTGPLVYPAGFVWLYGVLRWISMGGIHQYFFNQEFVLRSPLEPASIRVVQYIFIGMYVTTQFLVFSLYKLASPSRVPPWTVILLCISKRMHSLYALRLFNDCWAMFFLYLALYIWCKYSNKWWKWPIGCIFYSVAVSIKMNILLFSPALWMLMIIDIGMLGSLNCIFLCGLVQVLIGAPFLSHNFWGYIGRSFELGRVFTFKWSVNYKFLPENIFVSKELALCLLLCHVIVLGLFFVKKWYYPNMWTTITTSLSKTMQEGLHNSTLSIEFILLTMFTSNFIGIVFCRSLHYQFYCWYYHTVPYLLWQNEYVPVIFKIGCMIGLEFTWSYCLDPIEGTSTPLSSGVLQVTHLLMLIFLWWSRTVEVNHTKIQIVDLTKGKKKKL